MTNATDSDTRVSGPGRAGLRERTLVRLPACGSLLSKRRARYHLLWGSEVRVIPSARLQRGLLNRRDLARPHANSIEPGLLFVAQRGIEFVKGRLGNFKRLRHGAETHLHCCEP